MPDVWNEFLDPPELETVQNLVDQVNRVLGPILTVINAIAKGLEVVRAIAVSTLNLLSSIVEAIVSALQEFLFDLLEYNVAFSVHINMAWDPYWVWDKEKLRDKRTGRLDNRLIDFKKDNKIPWSGNGTDGWLLDVLASTKDKTDPFRPVTDATTAVYGVILIKGVSDASASEDIMDILDLFSNFEGLRVKKTAVDSLPETWQESVTSAGEAAYDHFLYGIYQAGPIDEQRLSLENQGLLTGVDADWRPRAGNFPKWISAPCASIIPPLGAALQQLSGVLGLLKPAEDSRNVIDGLIKAIETKTKQIEELLNQVDEAISFVTTLLLALVDIHVFVHDTPTGGMDAFLADALAADNKPIFGKKGVVAGLVLVATAGDVRITVDKFLGVIGIDTNSFLSTTTAQTAAFADTWEEVFP